MSKILFFALFVIPSTYFSFAQNDSDRYLIVENGLYGAINVKGKVTVDPKFHAIGKFSEGLAPARINGLFGYIDLRGKFLISEQFEIAEAFHNGVALVYIKQKPYLIDTTGKVLFEHDFSYINAKMNDGGLFQVQSRSNKIGLVDLSGKLILDTLQSKIRWEDCGLGIATRNGETYYKKWSSTDSIEKTRTHYGIVNQKGEIIVPFEKYTSIDNYAEGYLEVQKNGQNGLVDESGKEFLFLPQGMSFPYTGHQFNENRVVVDMNKNGESSKGIIDFNGKIIAHDDNWRYITTFRLNRAFVQTEDRKYHLINEMGEVLSSEPYNDIPYGMHEASNESMFQGGLEVVSVGRRWFIINTSGERIFEFPNDVKYFNVDSREGMIVYYKKEAWNLTTNTVFTPIKTKLAKKGEPELKWVQLENSAGYQNSTGEIVWQVADIAVEENQPLNIDHRLRGGFYAASKEKDESAPAGFGGSSNDYQKIHKPFQFPDSSIGLYVDTTVNSQCADKKLGYPVYLFNTEYEKVEFPAQDSRLYMQLEAKNEQGNWEEIMYLPSSWCGNSYHNLTLPKGHFWSFNVHQFEGMMPTTLRLSVFYIDGEEGTTIYSNEFSGSVNPGQFWNNLHYQPNGIMDPYDD